MQRALVVHSQPEALGELVQILVRPGLTVDTARSASEGLHKLSGRDYAVIISDHKPPELDGLELLEGSMSHCPDAMRILMAQTQDAAGDVAELPVGTVFRFFARPWERWQLASVVAEGLKLHRLEREQKELIKRISMQQLKLQRREKLLDVVVGERNKELEKSYARLRHAYRQAMFGLAETIEAKDPYTKGHCSRVAAFALALARDAGYPKEEMERLEFGSFLHDIGKIGIKDAVLLKPGPLDEDEWIHMREHPAKGYEIASKLDVLTPAMPAIRNHHERWEGGGYPDGLVGEAIPLSARICAIADAYDAMATDRPYKRALPTEECQRLIRKQAGRMFAPDLAVLFADKTIPMLVEQMYDEGDSYGEDDDEPLDDGVSELAASGTPSDGVPPHAVLEPMLSGIVRDLPPELPPPEPPPSRDED